MNREQLERGLSLYEESRKCATRKESVGHSKGTDWFDSQIAEIREILAHPVLPVLYQRRICETKSGWTAWVTCDVDSYLTCVTAPDIDGWQFEGRKLYLKETQ